MKNRKNYRKRKRRRKFNYHIKINKKRFLPTMILLLICIIFICTASSYIKKQYNSNTRNIFSEMRLKKNLNKSYPIKINEVTYKWKSDLDFKNFVPTRIVFHHTATSTATPQLVHQAHIANGWSGIGYHFLIRKDGSIYRGRPENAVGAHVYNHNKDSIGICLEGNFEKENITPEQEKSAAALCGMLMDKYGISEVCGHSHLFSTACPGKNFPLDKIISEAKIKAKEYK